MNLFGAEPVDRRAFLTMLPGGCVALHGLLLRSPLDPGPLVHLDPGEHPDPRPGVDGSKVMTAEQLVGAPHVIDLFDAIRKIPHIADGIRCHCGCAELEGYRSLLSCYEGPGAMATWCEVCQGEGRLAVRRHGEGQSLAEIRRAIDARFGSAGGHDHAMHASGHDRGSGGAGPHRAPPVR
jgi:hypothetical protein